VPAAGDADKEAMGKRLPLLAWLLPLWVAAVVAALGTRDPADLPYFAHAARTLFSSRWADTFADPSLQVGPLLLLLVGAGDRIGGLGFLAYAFEIGVAALVVFTVGRLLQGRPHRAAAQAVAGLAAVAVGITAGVYSFGHPAQAIVPLLWVLAALKAREGKTVRGGVLLGLAAGLEVWGVLGAPVLLLAPKPRRVLAGLAAQVGATMALFLPFVLVGDFRMLDYRWKVESWTLVRFLVPAGSDFPWGLRLLQGAVALAVGVAVAYALRRSQRAVWAVPLGIVAVRVLLDPTLYSWYWLGLETLALVAAVELALTLPARWSLPGPAATAASASRLRRG
jgi:hypothetical protein